MLIGEYRIRVGAKNRLSLPKKLREDLGEEAVVMRGYEGAVLVVSKKNWSSLVEEVLSGPLTDSQVRDTARFLMGGAHEVELDSQGRFVLPQPLVSFSGIAPKDVVVFVGLGRWVEIWSSERWSERLANLGERAAGNLKL
ncbi:division/cell wall cluster transcriptional repressor MraZ [Candidatus Saccharibacteria bacterium]|nr:division/cell wall cluster transcriptional repressor MraZ [Candidatus Saccharibacteria bacterium]